MVDRTEQLHRALQKFITHVDKLSEESDPAGNGFHREYRDLREIAIRNRDAFAATHGKVPHNIRKNRYKDIVPYDETRVILEEIPGIPGSDYINANFILDAHQREGYIASQGPLPHTLEDFWRMIDQYKVKVVMMACKEVEAGKKKCAQYWVENGAENGIFGQYEVACVGEDALADDCDERHLQLISPNKEIQNIYQYHYTGWPDHGIPEDIDVILAMIKRMRDHRNSDPNHAPVVVHCSAGCGRTGTICAIDYAWEILKSGQLTEEFNLFEIVKSMREQRQSMIQTPEQYEMAHLAVKELFQKHIEIMNESDYVNVELKNENKNKNENIADEDEYTEVKSDSRKLQYDALDTINTYMNPEDVPKAVEEPKKPQLEEPKVIKIVEKPQSEQKMEKEKLQQQQNEDSSAPKKSYENVFPESYENVTTPEEVTSIGSKSFAERQSSFEGQKPSPLPADTAPKFVSPRPASESNSSSSLPSAKSSVQKTKSSAEKRSSIDKTSKPEIVPRTSVVLPAPVSGPDFTGPVKHTPPPTDSTTQSGPKFVTSSQPVQQSGPRFVAPPQTQEQPKFKSVISVSSTASSISQGNVPHNVPKESFSRSQNLPNSANYELAQPVPEATRNSLNNVKLNLDSAVYAVPDKNKNGSATSSSLYSEVDRGNTKNPPMAPPVDSPYESIATAHSVKSKTSGRHYEDVQLGFDGAYSTVGELQQQNELPPVPKRDYQEPEPAHESSKSSVADKLKNKFSNTLQGRNNSLRKKVGQAIQQKFNLNTKSSSDSADSKATPSVPGFNERLDKKVKGPRRMPWQKKAKS